MLNKKMISELMYTEVGESAQGYGGIKKKFNNWQESNRRPFIPDHGGISICYGGDKKNFSIRNNF